MARFSMILIDEDGDVTGTNDSDVAREFAQAGYTVIFPQSGVWQQGESEQMPIEEAAVEENDDEEEEEKE